MKKFQAHHKLMALSSVALAGILTLNACGSTNTNSDSSASATSSSSATASGSAQSSSGPIKIENTWAKATDGGMTGVFGKITNTSDHDVKVVSATSTATDEVQLHTTVKDSNGSTKMQQVQEFTVKAGETLELKPGGNHIMLMGLNCSLSAGASTTVTLKTEDGATLEFKPEARDYSGAKEEYQGDAQSTGSASADASASASGDSHDGHEHSHEHGHGDGEHSDHEHSHGDGEHSDHEHGTHEHGEHSDHDHMSGEASGSASAKPQCK